MKVNELLAEKTIAHYDEVARNRLTVGKMISKLNDSSLPQADTDAIVAAVKAEGWDKSYPIKRADVVAVTRKLKADAKQEVMDILEL